jgi:hypothetical protein
MIFAYLDESGIHDGRVAHPCGVRPAAPALLRSCTTFWWAGGRALIPKNG